MARNRASMREGSSRGCSARRRPPSGRPSRRRRARRPRRRPKSRRSDGRARSRLREGGAARRCAPPSEPAAPLCEPARRRAQGAEPKPPPRLRCAAAAARAARLRAPARAALRGDARARAAARVRDAARQLQLPRGDPRRRRRRRRPERGQPDDEIDAGISAVEFVAVNTDMQQLQISDAPVKIHIGRELTQGLLRRRAGDRPPRRRGELRPDQERLRGSDMVFVTAGEGGGTGTGAAPVVARIARELARSRSGSSPPLPVRGVAPQVVLGSGRRRAAPPATP